MKWPERNEGQDMTEHQRHWLASLRRECKMVNCKKTMKIKNVDEAAESKNQKWPYYECLGPHGFTKSGNQWLNYQEIL